MLSGSPPPLAGYTASSLLTAPKNQQLVLELKSHGQQVSLRKTPGESINHVVLKGLLWALMLPLYRDAVHVERDIGLRYRPDVIALEGDSVLWWGECGSVKPGKLSELATAFPQAQFSVCKFGRSDLRGFATSLISSLPKRSLPNFEVINFPADSVERFINDYGEVSESFGFDELQRVPLAPDAELTRTKQSRRRRTQ
jgi:hypothetical protein